MKSTLFASTLAAALTATSLGQVEVELIGECCDGWNYTYQNEVLTFISSEPFGYTSWNIQVPEDTLVQFTCFMLDPNSFIDVASNGPLTAIQDTWNAQGQPSVWSGTVVLPAGNYFADFLEFEGTINFDYELEPQGSCCVNSGCSSTGETTCTELGGTWTEGGSCDDCEPVADDCPADTDGDGIPDVCDADSNLESPYPGATYWDPAEGGNGHWYVVVESNQVGWTTASEDAELLGGHLATLTSPDENQFILPLVPSVLTNPGPGYWIGGRDFGSGWQWITGETFSYSSWGDDTGNCNQQPDGRDAIDLYCVNGDGSLSWSDDFVDSQGALGYVVEWSVEDCNSNGIIDSCENVPDDCGDEPCPADVDGDGSIGFSDVLIILNDWGACP